MKRTGRSVTLTRWRMHKPTSAHVTGVESVLGFMQSSTVTFSTMGRKATRRATQEQLKHQAEHYMHALEEMPQAQAGQQILFVGS